MRIADYIISRVYEAGARDIFMVTGRGALFLTDAVAKHGELRSTCMHHEQSAAFAAVAYAQQTNGLGACLVSTGCASTNALTGVLSAWQDGIACIFISGQNTLRETSRHTGIPLRTYGQQEADIVAIVQPITKYAAMITRPEQIVEALDMAISLATSGRKGPVWLDIPLDIQSAIFDLPNIPFSFTTRKQALTPSATDLEFVAKALSEAARPVILLGSGIRSASAEKLLTKFVESADIPVVYTASCPDTYGSAHSLSIGSVGSMGCSRAGNFALQNADLLLVLGSRLTSLTTGPDFSKFARAAKVIVVDIDPVEHSKEGVRIEKFIHADLNTFLSQLSVSPPPPTRQDWVTQCEHWKRLFGKVESNFEASDRVDLYQLAASLSDQLPMDSTLITDSGFIEVILPTNVAFKSGMSCIHPASQGSMGFALPAAIGAYRGNPRTTLVVVGDGSIMMNLQELETIRYQKFPIKIIVVNNNIYSIIRRRQKDLFRKRTIGTDPENGLSCPDFAKVATCFGLDYQHIETPGDLQTGLSELLSSEKATLCEIMGREDQSYIEISQTRSLEDKRFVRRPLEDQAPFLDRSLFLREMIIAPIDQ